jgi:hypothetical protein
MFVDEDYQRERLAGTTEPKYLLEKYSKWTKQEYAMILLIIAGLVVFVALFSWKACIQHFRLKNCVPVEAEVVSVDKKFFKSVHLTEGYQPLISFKYMVEGQIYTNDWLTSMKELPHKSRSEVDKFLDDYPLGKRITVYYIPGKPERAFLLKYRHWNSFQGLVVCSIPLSFLIWLVIPKNYKYAFQLKSALCIFWFVVGFICYGYYFTYAKEPYSVGVIIRCAIYLFFGLVWVYNLFKPKVQTKIL